ncbi:DUF4304 domain-containing protein [Burkholderia sp. LMG 32019]|uniref:DUF4304 domain-containing protein n=1 Tax=Burkholderia sp. LMG 32019 TaxID=3158173 RepID=UPI003C2F2B15
MKEVLKKIAPSLRTLGFRGSGQNFRKQEGDFVFLVNFQGSRCRDKFYVNLGAQAVFIPAEGNADLSKLKEYECMLRRRVGDDWPWQMPDEQFVQLEAKIRSVQAEFFGNAQTLRGALAIDGPDDLLRKFDSGTTRARAALHLARGAATLGYFLTARNLVNRGVELAGARANGLRDELGRVLDECSAIPHNPAS